MELKKIKEGDKITPKGTYLLTKLYYRSDRIKQIKSSLNCKLLKETWDGVMIQIKRL